MKGVTLFLIVLLLGCCSTQPTTPISITAPALAIEYQLDPKEADKHYKGKLLRVEGEVYSTSKGIILLKGDSFHVACSMRDADRIKTAKLKRGQKVVLEGECRGKTVAVLLVACVLKLAR